MFRILMAALLLVSLSVSASEEPQLWSTAVELGAVFTSGNTEQESIKFRVDSTRSSDPWINSFHFNTFMASEDGNDTADKFYTFYRLDYQLSEDSTVFARIAYEEDEFSGFDSQTDLTAGYNRKLLSRENLVITGDVGAGVRRIEEVAGESTTEALLRLAGHLTWDISENARFTQALGFEIGEELTTTRSESALETIVVGDLTMKLAVAVKHNSDVPAGNKETDTESTVTLVYKF